MQYIYIYTHKAVLADVAIHIDSDIRKKHEKLLKDPGLKEEQEKMMGAKASVIPVVIGALGAVIPKLGDWLKTDQGKKSEISI